MFPGLHAAQAGLALRIPLQDPAAYNTADGTSDAAAAAPALAATQVYLPRPLASGGFLSGDGGSGNGSSDGIDSSGSSSGGLVWLGAGLLAPWLNGDSPCGCPPPAALLVHALVGADAALEDGLELLQATHECPCGFEPWVLVATPRVRRSVNERWAASNSAPGSGSSSGGKRARDEDPPLAAAAGRCELACPSGHPMTQERVEHRASCDG